MSKSDFQFAISLSVLNHLGRNLYRNFITVLGEAISNSWDADAKNVWIDIDKDNSVFSIKDDGDGMTGSLIILDVADKAEAEEFATNDPYGKAGLFESVTIQAWKEVFAPEI